MNRLLAPADDRDVPTVLIVGAPRSGTSLLYKVLCLHPDTSWISNWTNRFGAIPVTAPLNRVAARFPERRRSVWFGDDGGNAYVYGRSRPSAERAFPMPVEGERIFAGLGAPLPVGRERRGHVDTDALRETIRRVRRFAGGSVFVSKRVINNWYLDQLEAGLSNVRYVHMLRDGRGVAASLQEVDWWEGSVVSWWGGTPAQWRAEGRDPWELVANTWVEETTLVDDFLETVPAERQLTVRYEDLLEDPINMLMHVAHFAQVDADGWCHEIAQLQFPKHRARSWESRLDAHAQETVDAVQGPLLTRLGYR